jgi:hypothetical protein
MITYLAVVKLPHAVVKSPHSFYDYNCPHISACSFLHTNVILLSYTPFTLARR